MSHNDLIVHICSNRWNSAIAEYALSVGRSLAERPQHFIVLSGSPLAARLKNHGFHITELKHFRLTKLFALSAIFHSLRATHVVTYGGPETTLCRILKRWHPLKLVRFFGDAARLARGRKFIVRTDIAALLVPSKRLAAFFRRSNPSKPIFDVTLGCDDAIFTYGGEETRASERARLLIFGRFDPVKGHVHAMRVFKKLLATYEEQDTKKPQLWIVGLPANLSLDDLLYTASELALTVGDDIIIKAERIADVPGLMRSMHLGWVSSLGSEVICRVAEEFLLCGTMVFLSGVGSLDECLYEGAGASYQYPTLDDDAIVALLKKAIRDAVHESPAVRQKRAQQAKERFGFEAMSQQLQRIFSSI